jgi:hypothetical protein
MSEADRPTARELAHRFLALGLSVIPVPRPRPGAVPGQPGDGKVPTLAWTAYQTRLPTTDEIDAWFATPMNLAIVTGALSGVVVIDADATEAVRWAVRRLPYTPWQTKTARGFHLWYRHSGVRVPNRARIATQDGRLPMDVRGDGGFVIAPGSIHASGLKYREAGDWTAPRDRLPMFSPGWLERPAVPATLAASKRPVVGTIEPFQLLARARAYLAAIPRPEIGAGSDQAVWKAACRLTRGFAFSVTDAEDLLWEWAGDRPGWTREWIAQKVRHAEKNGKEPHGALR